MEQCWSGTGSGTPNYRRELYLRATFYTTSPTWAGLGSNLGLRDERPATDRLIHGKAETTDDFVSNVTGSKIIAGPVRNSLVAGGAVQRVTAVRTNCAVTLRRTAVHDRLSVRSLYKICAQNVCYLCQGCGSFPKV